MDNEYVWVIGYTTSIKNPDKFIRCAKNNSVFYKELYESEGMKVDIITSSELEKITKCNEHNDGE